MLFTCDDCNDVREFVGATERSRFACECGGQFAPSRERLDDPPAPAAELAR